MKSAIFSVVALAAVSSAAPLQTRSAPTDADILNYALTLEHLEDTFYREGMAKYGASDFKAAGFADDVYTKFQTIAYDEKTHVTFITNALKAAGATPVSECKYDFGYNDVTGFVTVASMLEGVGISAYLGAAADIMSKGYLTAAGSILTIESRHTSYIRNQLKLEPAAEPFDKPLSLNSVYTLAAQFITSCPSSNPTLPVKSFPVITASSTDSSIKATSTVTLTTKNYKISGTVYAAFISATGPIFGDAKAVDGGFEITVPKGVAGQSYVVLTSCNTVVSDDTIVAGPAIVEIAGSVDQQ